MNARTPCASPEALVTYLYDECDPAERQSIAAHVAICSICAAEVEALSDTRAHLASWSPPALPLGFQMTRTESDQPAKVLRPARFWNRPLPAWAQVAAAAVIFAAGMSVNAFRAGEQPARVVQAPQQQIAPVADRQPGDDFSVTREQFARFEARLRAVERADVSRASYVSGTPDDDLRAQVKALTSRVAESERQNLESFAKVAVALNSQRRDIEANRETAQKVTLMDEELQDHRQVLLRAAPGLAVRTALTTGGR